MIYEGPCAGGPKHDQKLASECQRITIPIVRPTSSASYMIPRPLEIDYYVYEWHSALRMWIWHE